MTTTDSGQTGDDHDAASGIPDHVVAAAQVGAADAETRTKAPGWINKWVWQSLWKAVVVGLATAIMLLLAFRMESLLRMLVVSIFFAIATIPAINWIHGRWGWKRGAAVGAIYAGMVVFVVLMVVVLIPAIVNFADEVGSSGTDWTDKLNSWAQDTFGKDLVNTSTAQDAASTTNSALSDWANNLAGLASSGIGFVFGMMTVALFTFYFAADAPRIQHALLSRMRPHRQQVWGWVVDTAIAETGGYFYSRMLLMVINGGLFFVVMLLVGMPLIYALPLSIFEGFVAEFIPAVGTYIGAAVPILLTLAVQGFGAALILLIWVLIYQQVENYFLSPRLSAKTMTLNGGVAFGAALAGGAIAGPMGAFMALPVAALITSIITNATKTYGTTYDVIYHSTYAPKDGPQQAPPTTSGEEAPSTSTA
jgi:predicted PurR-regulated permease PerM